MSSRTKALCWSAGAFFLLMPLCLILADLGSQRRTERAVERAQAAGLIRSYDALVPPVVADSENFWGLPELAKLRQFLATPTWAANAPQSSEILPGLRQVERALVDARALEGEPDLGHFPAMADALVQGGCVPPGGPPAATILVAMEPLAPVLDAICSATTRPQFRAPMRYDLGPALTSLPYSTMRQICGLLGLRALARAAVGQPREGAADLLALLRLAEGFQRESVLVLVATGFAVEFSTLSYLRAGLRSGCWGEPELAAFERRPETQPLRALGRALEFEVACAVKAELSQLRGESPSWGAVPETEDRSRKEPVHLRLARRSMNQFTISRLPDIWPAYARLFDPARFEKAAHGAWKEQAGIFGVVGELTGDTTARMLARALQTIAQARLATVAIAAERARQRTGRYPAENPLGESEVERVDPITLSELNYDCTEDGRGVTIYSVGWDEEDNDGQPCKHGALEPGDWVWRLGTAEPKPPKEP